MSKTRLIPSNADPWMCCINGIWYSYEAGSTQTVPDSVAAVIDNYNALRPVEASEPTVDVGKYSITAGVGAVVDFTGALLKGFPAYTLPAATTSKIGGVKKAAKVNEAEGEAPTAAEFNALLDALKTAGIMAT